MSILLLHQPASIMSASEPIYYKLQTQNGNTVQVRVVVMRVDNGARTTIAEWHQKPDLGTADNYTVQIDEVLEDQLGYDVPLLNNDLLQDRSNSLLEYKVAFQGLDSDGYTTASLVTPEPGEIYALNGAATELEVEDIEPFLLENKDRYFLTNSSTEKWIGNGDHEYLDTVGLEDEQHDLLIRFNQKDGALRFNYSPIFNTEKGKAHRIQVGPSIINNILPGFIDDNTLSYDVYLRSMIGNNLFMDGDNGTFETSVVGLSSPAGVALTRVNTESRTGSYSMSAVPTNGTANTFSDLWRTDTTYTLQSGKTYRFTVRFTYHVNTISQDSITIRPYATGFSDAVMVADQYELSANSYANGYYFTKSLWLTVGNDTTGQFCFQFNNDLPGVTIYFDDMELHEEVTSDKLRSYKIDRECHTDPTRVHFMNKLGGFDSFTFIGTERLRLVTTGEVYERRRPLGRSARDRGVIDLQKQGQRTLQCSSGALTPEEMIWLEELLVSPAVYVERDNELLPVILKNGEFELLNRQKNIHKLNVQLQYSNTGASQRN